MKQLFLAMTVLALAACPQAPDPDLECDESPTARTLATDVQPIFTAKCALSGCHDATYATSYGDFTTEQKSAAIVNKKSLYAGKNATLKVIDPNAPANSSMWLKVLGGRPGGRSGPKGENVLDRMPYEEDPLPDADKKILKDWICTGAK